VSFLTEVRLSFFPKRVKPFYKYCWNEELTLLKGIACDADKVWKAVGKPRSGPIFTNRQRSRLDYRRLIKERQQSPTLCYTNDLHEAFLNKNGTAFWKC